MREVLLVLGMMAVTFGVRYGSMLLVGKLTLPPAMIRALRFVPAAVLTAIIAPAMLMPGGQIDAAPTNAYLYAGLFSAGVAWRTRNMLWTIILGMAFFWLWRWQLGQA